MEQCGFNQDVLKEILVNIPNKLSDAEASWLAGVIDGEGSIGLYDYGKEGRRGMIQMGNTSKEFVEKFKDLIGGGSSIKRTVFGVSHKGRKPMYHYTLKGSARCYVVLKQIIPYLIIKKEKAIKIVEEIENKPFGRWKNCTEEARKQASETAKKSWQDSIVRKRRIDGLRKYYGGMKT